MTLVIPTTQQILDRSLATFEAKLNQTVPLVDKAFLRVVSAILAMNETELYKYGVERALQNLALTATGEDLDTIGTNYGVNRKSAVAAELRLLLTGTPGSPVSISTQWLGDANGLRYSQLAAVVISAGGDVLVSTQCQTPGVEGNLPDLSTLTIGAQLPGVSSVATVQATETDGLDRETDTSYRRRILNEIRTVGGGGNGVDYRTWAEEVIGVEAAFPYAGAPPSEVSLPGDRTVYVMATSDVSPDHIPPPSLLAEVRAAINIDPETGLSRPALGMTNDGLYVEPIFLTAIYVEIRGFDPGTGTPGDVKTAIENALAAYLAIVFPFITGTDVDVNRNDTVTDLTLSLVVQRVLAGYGGEATGIGFGLAPLVFIPSYMVGQGELVVLGAINYA